jgi:outer membrane immunogenic protein
VGWTFDRLLIFGKGGGALIRDRYLLSNVNSVFGGIFDSSTDETRGGWMFGASVEYAFTPSWSAKLEYDFLNFGTRTVHFPPAFTQFYDPANAPGSDVNIREQVHLIKLGINYHFNWGKAPFGKEPVVARY